MTVSKSEREELHKKMQVKCQAWMVCDFHFAVRARRSEKNDKEREEKKKT
jgi:hypothetical protein